MKTDIHPKYFASVEIKCSCGNTILAGSTKEKLRTELCSKCHPFYTGHQKLIDTAGRVDKFVAKQKKAEAQKAEKKARTEAKKKKPEAYQEKEIPLEVLERAGALPKNKGKWGTPLGDTMTEEVEKETKAAKEKAAKSPTKKPRKTKAA